MIDNFKEEQAAILRGSLLEFTRTFFEIVTGREFIISKPIGRESHYITICRALTKAFRLELKKQRLNLNVPPGHGKSVLLCMFVAWCWTHYPDSNFLYISYSKSLAAKHTEFIKRIVESRHYKYLFDIHVKQDSRAKDLFKNTHGGTVGAYGSSGAITGQDAGLPGLDRFSGAVIIDDAHKPDEVHSDTMRESVINNYRETIQQRARGVNVPILFVGQRLHESDLADYFIQEKDGYEWEHVILKAIDDAGNALYPEAFTKESLLIKKDKDPYVFYSQMQQEPQPAGGSLYKKDWFVLLDYEPTITNTFLTVDTAETEKSWNDATVFSFWGIHEIEIAGKKTGEIGLHWLDCAELRVEPKDLYDEFMRFYSNCLNHPVRPKFAAIEKKSTGVTLISTIKNTQGINILEIERNRASGSKSQRFIDAQSYYASRLVSFTRNARHADKCIEHMCKITANNVHAFDDIADTACDAVRLVYIDKLISTHDNSKNNERKEIVRNMSMNLRKKINAGKLRYE